MMSPSVATTVQKLDSLRDEYNDLQVEMSQRNMILDDIAHIIRSDMDNAAALAAIVERLLEWTLR